MIVVGIDPGLDGYACMLGCCSAPCFWPAPVIGGSGGKRSYDVPSLVGISISWRETGVDFVVVERQHAFPRIARGRTQGVVSSFSTGFGYGLWIASLAAAGLSVEEVLPQRWKAALGCLGGGGGRRDADRRMILRAQTLDPDTDFRPVERSGADPRRLRVPCPDKAASRLIAEYGRRMIISSR